MEGKRAYIILSKWALPLLENPAINEPHSNVSFYYSRCNWHSKEGERQTRFAAQNREIPISFQLIYQKNCDFCSFVSFVVGFFVLHVTRAMKKKQPNAIFVFMTQNGRFRHHHNTTIIIAGKQTPSNDRSHYKFLEVIKISIPFYLFIFRDPSTSKKNVYYKKMYKCDVCERAWEIPLRALESIWSHWVRNSVNEENITTMYVYVWIGCRCLVYDSFFVFHLSLSLFINA